MMVACGGAEGDHRFGIADTEQGDGAGDDGGTVADSDGDWDVPPPRAGGEDSDDETTLVPLDTPAEQLSMVCQPRPADSRVLGASPNGELWLASGGAADAVTVLRGDAPPQSWSLPWPVTQARGWSSTTATLAGGEGLWTFDDGVLTPIRWVDGLAAPFGLCGDPSVEGDGYVLADDLFSRDLGQWWRWNIPGGPLATGDAFATSAGACRGESERAWLRRGSEVWSVATDWVGVHPELSPSLALAADDSFGVASLVLGGLVVVDEHAEQTLRFEAGEVHTIGAAPSALWVAAGAHLYRQRGGAMAEVQAQGGSLAPQGLWPYPGGAWIGLADAVCQLRAQDTPFIAVQGLREYQRLRGDVVTLDIVVAGGALPSVTLDDAPIVVEPHDGDRYRVQLDALPEGWHTLAVGIDQQRRAVPFVVERLSAATWEDTIEPLFAEHCAGGVCHGPNPNAATQADLSSYDTWFDLADTVTARVVLTGDMPPLSARKASWGVDEVLEIAGWVQAGLPRKDDQ